MKNSFLQSGTKYLPVILERSEESGQRIRVLNTLYRLSYAGFFATHNNLFFNILFLYVCLPPLKNDGRDELRFREVVNDFSPKKKSTGNVSCPRLSGKVAAKPSEGASMSRNGKTVSYRTELNTCLSFSNGRKKRSGIQE